MRISEAGRSDAQWAAIRDEVRAMTQTPGWRHFIEHLLQESKVKEDKILLGLPSFEDYIRASGYRAGLQYAIGAAEALIGEPQEGPTT